MGARVKTRRKGGVVVVETSGKITLGERSSTLRTEIRDLVDAGSRKILLDMAEVSYMDSSGLGELLASHTTVTAAGGKLKLLNVSSRVGRILEITRTGTVFETFEDEALAIDSFSDRRITDQAAAYSPAKETLLWALQIVTAAAFFLAAFPKWTGAPVMLDLFDKIGLGQWFRYFTGTLEVLGGLLLLIPGLAGPGAVLLLAVMSGAIVAHVAKLGGSPAHALSYLVLAALIAWFRSDQISKYLPKKNFEP